MVLLDLSYRNRYFILVFMFMLFKMIKSDSVRLYFSFYMIVKQKIMLESFYSNILYDADFMLREFSKNMWRGLDENIEITNKNYITLTVIWLRISLFVEFLFFAAVLVLM